MARSDHPWFVRISWQEAERLLGHKVNRRRKFFTQSAEGKKETDNPWAFNQYPVLTYSEWSDACSGCTDSYEGVTHGPFGCQECGHTGKRRTGGHFPYIIKHEIEFNGLKKDQANEER